MLAADRAADGEHCLVQLVGQRLHLAARRPESARSRNGRMCNCPWPAWPNSEAVTWCRLSTFCIVDQKVGQRGGRNRHVFDERQRSRRALAADTAWARPCGPVASRGPTSSGRTPGGRRRPAACGDRTRSTMPQAVAHFDCIVPLVLDQQHGLGLRRNQRVVARRRSRGPGSDAGDPSGRRRWAETAEFPSRPGRPFQAVEQQQGQRRDAAAAAGWPA